MTFKVEIRKTCKVCGKEITGKRMRTYCGSVCRNKFYNKKYYPKQKIYQQERYDRIATIKEGKLQCIICGLWYIQVGTHVRNRHNMTAREYREEYNLPVKRGISPTWFREVKGEIALNNGTASNLKKGVKFRFTKGDVRAKTKTFWKSSGHTKPDVHYYN